MRHSCSPTKTYSCSMVWYSVGGQQGLVSSFGAGEQRQRFLFGAPERHKCGMTYFKRSTTAGKPEGAVIALLLFSRHCLEVFGNDVPLACLNKGQRSQLLASPACGGPALRSHRPVPDAPRKPRRAARVQPGAYPEASGNSSRRSSQRGCKHSHSRDMHSSPTVGEDQTPCDTHTFGMILPSVLSDLALLFC